MGPWETVLTAVGGSAVLIGAVAWLVRSLMLHLLSKDLETFKGQLQLAAFEHQVRFTQLHERRASILADLYSKIVQLHHAATNFVKWYASANDDEKKQRLDQLWLAADDYQSYFEKHLIYFDQPTCDKVDSLNGALSRATSVLAVFTHEGKGVTVTEEDILKEWEKAMTAMDQEIPQLKRSIENCFRAILGVE